MTAAHIPELKSASRSPKPTYVGAIPTGFAILLGVTATQQALNLPFLVRIQEE